MAGLAGEITILDSIAVVADVSENGRSRAIAPDAVKATLLVGPSIGEWAETKFAEDVPHDRVDEAIRSAAARMGAGGAKPFVFRIEGDFRDVRQHVIQGTCPIHSRINKIDLTPKQKPYELEAERVNGGPVGICAKDAAGRLTHPATSVHAYRISNDEETGERVTGHLERVGLAAGAVLKVPARPWGADSNGLRTGETMTIGG